MNKKQILLSITYVITLLLLTFLTCIINICWLLLFKNTISQELNIFRLLTIIFMIGFLLMIYIIIMIVVCITGRYMLGKILYI